MSQHNPSPSPVTPGSGARDIQHHAPDHFQFISYSKLTGLSLTWGNNRGQVIARAMRANGLDESDLETILLPVSAGTERFLYEVRSLFAQATCGDSRHACRRY